MSLSSLAQRAEAFGLRPLRQGKVRDLWQWRDELWLIASDRVSAYDVILPTPIPDKGKLLTKLSRFWFDKADWIPNHVLSYELPDGADFPEWQGRVTRGRPCYMIPLECVARGYLAGSGWEEYRTKGTVGGFLLPGGLREGDKLPTPLFTPAKKNDAGHDENVSEGEAIEFIGQDKYWNLREHTLRLYNWAAEYAEKRGVIIADTKVEFGLEETSGRLLLADEILTPDSSRFWPMDEYQPGKSQPSYDKQFLRDYLKGLTSWNRQPPGPELPEKIVEQTRSRYEEAVNRLIE